jgi:hypothetical protein
MFSMIFENTPVTDKQTMFGDDIGTARQFIERQATKQALGKVTKWGAGIVGLSTAEEAIRRLFF